MKVLLVNGSPNKNGSTNRALEEVAKNLEQENIETEIFWIEKKSVGGCMACFKCIETGKCISNDSVNIFREKAYSADGFIFGSPTHYAGISGNLKGFMNVEVEFPTVKDAVLFEPPEWFGAEVTGDRRYSNASLVKYGIPVKK